METHGHTVLAVDNDSVDRSTICAGLTDQGYTVLEAEGGQQALEMLHRRQSVDAVLVDLVMPGMDGFQVLSRMKADRVLRSIPVIVSPGSTLPDSTCAGFSTSSGCSSWCVSPTNPSVSSVSRALPPPASGF